MRIFCLSIVLISNTLILKSQTTYQQIYWTRLYVRVKLSDKWSWQTEADNRRLFGENQQVQFIAHTHIHRKLSKNMAHPDKFGAEGSLGFTYSDVWQGNLPVHELRPFQEFYLFTKINDKWRFSQRIRTEQRWFHNFSGEHLTDGYNFKFRFRYMPRLEFRLNEKWLFKTNTELMYHHDDFDQWRVYGAAEYKFKKDLSLEIGYLKLIQKKANNKGYFDRDNVRVTLYKDFDLSKKEDK
jgi:hypothetical protein